MKSLMPLRCKIHSREYPLITISKRSSIPEYNLCYLNFLQRELAVWESIDLVCNEKTIKHFELKDENEIFDFVIAILEHEYLHAVLNKIISLNNQKLDECNFWSLKEKNLQWSFERTRKRFENV